MKSYDIITNKFYGGLMESARKNRRSPRHLTASNISACRRRNWYAIKKVTVPDSEGVESDPILLSKFRDGNMAHLDIKNMLKQAGLPVLGEEFDVYCGDIHARIDAATSIPGLGDTNIEFKTMANSSFLRFVKEGIISFPSYYAQCQVILGSEPKRPLILWAKNKNTSEFSDELVERDEDFIEQLKTRKKNFDTSLEADYPPERDYSYNSYECKNCEYLFKCWFTTIMRRTLFSSDLSPTEKKSVDNLVSKLKEAEPSYNHYLFYNIALKDYIAMLHTRHSADRVKLQNVNSSMVKSQRETPNLDYIKSILTDEQYSLAFNLVSNTCFRTRLLLERKE